MAGAQIATAVSASSAARRPKITATQRGMRLKGSAPRVATRPMIKTGTQNQPLPKKIGSDGDMRKKDPKKIVGNSKIAEMKTTTECETRLMLLAGSTVIDSGGL